MKKPEKSKISRKNTKGLHPPDFTSPDIDSDKTGTDNDADKTVKQNKSAKSKFEKDPDTTGIDTKADKTKKETFPKQPKKK